MGVYKSNAAIGAKKKEARRRSKEVGLPTGVKANSDKEIAKAAKKKGVDVPTDNTKAVAESIKLRSKRKLAAPIKGLAAKKKGVDVPTDNTKAETTLIENRGKGKTAGNPVATTKKKLAGQIRDIAKEKARKAKSKKQPKKIKRAK